MAILNISKMSYCFLLILGNAQLETSNGDTKDQVAGIQEELDSLTKR